MSKSASQDPKIQPIGLRVLVKPEEAEEKTAGGLYIPPTANEDKKPASGTVVRLGVLTDKEKAFVVKVDDRVYFKKYAPEELEVDGVKYLIVDQDDILGIVSK